MYKSFLELLNILLTPAVALIGVILSIRLVKSKLIENNITTTLNLIQETDRKTRKSTQVLIDEISRLGNGKAKVDIDELRSVFEKIQQIYYEALYGNSESATYLHFLKATIQSYISIYDKDKDIDQPIRIYAFIRNILEEVVFYCTQAVPVPKSVAVRKEAVIHKSIAKFVKYPSFSKYRYFNTGVVQDGQSAHYLLFFEHLTHSSILMCIAASRTLSFKRPILVYLYRKSVYAPVLLRPQGVSDFFDDQVGLELIRIQFDRSYNGSDIKQMVRLTYRNAGFGDVVTNLKEEHLATYFDTIFPGESVNLEGSTGFKKEGHACFTVTIDKDVLQEYFKNLKTKMKRELKVK